jgi:benzodiazapine receptor
VTEIASRGQLRMSVVRWALVCVPAVVLLGTLSGILSNSGDGNGWFRNLTKPSFMPPSWAFPVAWTILYICLGLSLALLLNARGARGRGPIITLFVVQLLLNFSWSPVFFGMHKVGLALAIIAVMILLTIVLIAMTWRVRRNAALLLAPYLAWLCFAAALNYSIWSTPQTSQVAPGASSTNIPLN